MVLGGKLWQNVHIKFRENLSIGLKSEMVWARAPVEYCASWCILPTRKVAILFY